MVDSIIRRSVVPSLLLLLSIGFAADCSPSARSEDSDDSVRKRDRVQTRFEIECAPVYVDGFPMLVTIVATHDGDGSQEVTDYGLQSQYHGGIGVQFEFRSKNGEAVTVGYSGHEFTPLPPGTGVPGAPRVWLSRHEVTQTTLDLRQLLSSVQSSPWHRFPGPGDWTLRAKSVPNSKHSPSLVSNEVELQIRLPTDQEVRVAESLSTDGVGMSWFPSIVFSEESTPRSLDLPSETKTIVNLITVLRSAVLSPELCIYEVDALSRSGEGWDHLKRFVNLVKYECAIESDEELAAKSAEESLRTWDHSNIKIDKAAQGQGVVRNLREVFRSDR
jgi:hypothetical protein